MSKRILLLNLCSALVFFFFLPLSLNAQGRSREYIRQKISDYGECRNVAITSYNGDLMLYGDNGWAATGCPTGLTNALHKLNEDEELIDDVQLTDDGKWLILYGDNGLRWNDIPYSLEKKLREYNSNHESITSVTFNDDGDWIVITTKHFSTSDSKITEWIAEGMEDYGGVYTACITDEAIVVVYEDGFRFLGDVPEDLINRLRKADFDVYRLKIASDGSWFFSDGKRRYRYNM